MTRESEEWPTQASNGMKEAASEIERLNGCRMNDLAKRKEGNWNCKERAGGKWNESWSDHALMSLIDEMTKEWRRNQSKLRQGNEAGPLTSVKGSEAQLMNETDDRSEWIRECYNGKWINEGNALIGRVNEREPKANEVPDNERSATSGAMNGGWWMFEKRKKPEWGVNERGNEWSMNEINRTRRGM